MKMNEGVEWAMHSCVNLSWIPGRAVTAKHLAAFYDLPTAYLNKQLQALARAGILTSTSGPKGGFQLARDPERISLLDIVVAIDGAEDAFRCREILKDGPGADPKADYVQICQISQAMRGAELTYRRELAGRTIAEIADRVVGANPAAPENVRRRFDNLKS
ncbi:Rrf2 family transcriptional regulator [Kribbella sandramycini]|uniref:Rrf2 family protein n=1 Tax=Kribbella sandramycini TaxID=60450 RepID=A0A7Y4L320_9ACTN|nr:Rrf2 family transcriptional regulator [Kribbella sandramycini]MBB6564807.1 Rrf2 family protein [Kribbella sandramycini]NOL42506.1 Rrf2 family transcriptional regulator [Kribbella sandramycini]